MADYKEKHEIGKETKGFQLVSEDIDEKDIFLWANFTFKDGTDEILETDFILKNRKNINSRFKIHKVLYCDSYKRIEVHLSHHKNFKEVEYDAIENQSLKGLVMKEGDEVKMLIRVTPNSRISNPDWECENLPGGNPDDKDGSILIGRRP